LEAVPVNRETDQTIGFYHFSDKNRLGVGMNKKPDQSEYDC